MLARGFAKRDHCSHFAGGARRRWEPRVVTGVFVHGVASGDPLPDAIVLWTHVTTDQPRVPVDWVLARDRALEDVVARGTDHADAKDDHTVHVDVTGLEPATTY